MRATVAALVCVLALPVNAATRPPTALAKPAACKLNYADELKEAHKIAARPGWGVYPLEGKDVAKFLGVFNSAEPKTDFAADAILVAVAPQLAYVELFSGGCMSHEARLAPQAFDTMMREAFGGEIPGATAI